MMRNKTKTTLGRIGAGLLLSCVLLHCEASAQGSAPAQGEKGTKRRIANPLNDLLEEARRDIDKFRLLCFFIEISTLTENLHLDISEKRFTGSRFAQERISARGRLWSLVLIYSSHS